MAEKTTIIEDYTHSEEKKGLGTDLEQYGVGLDGRRLSDGRRMSVALNVVENLLKVRLLDVT